MEIDFGEMEAPILPTPQRRFRYDPGGQHMPPGPTVFGVLMIPALPERRLNRANQRSVV